MEEPGESRKRRDSIERYDARAGKTNDDIDQLTEQFRSYSMKEQKPEREDKGRGRRRAVNNHLYSRGNFHGQPNHQSREYHQPNGWHRNDHQEHWKYKSEQKFHQTHSGRGRGSSYHNQKGFSPPKRNTETFKPSHKPSDMRILTAHSGWKKYNRDIQSRDVLIIHDLFCAADDLTIYNKLLEEIRNSGISETDIWQSWHGDSHLIADDKKKWKDSCPTFHMILDGIRDYFDMDIKATRLNWYRDSSEWKPFHHDAAAIKPDKAKTQNLTVAVSFGAERDAAFEHATTKTVISMPQPNGTMYVFAKDVNVIWRHGILQTPPEKYNDQGRISIIAWGWATQVPMAADTQIEDDSIKSFSSDVESTSENSLGKNDLLGYIVTVSELRLSASNNEYFDVDVKVNPDDKRKIRVMSDSNYNHEFFAEKCNFKVPVLLKNLSPAKSGQIFFNSQRGSCAMTSPRNLQFDFEVEVDLSAEQIHTETPAGRFSVTGQIVWQTDTKAVKVGDAMKNIREAKFVDASGSINMTVWGDELISSVFNNKTYRFFGLGTNVWNGSLQLCTTLATEIREVDTPTNWEVVDLQTTKLCCPEIVSVRVEKYMTCCNESCKKKLPYANQPLVKCNNCNQLMQARKCSPVCKCQVTVEVDGIQINLTMYPPVDEANIGKELLLLRDVDIYYLTDERVVTKMVGHKND